MKPAYIGLVISILFLSACGGGGGSSSSSAPAKPEPVPAEPTPVEPVPEAPEPQEQEPEPDDQTLPDISYQAGVYLPSETFQHYCEAPRSGIDPQTRAAYADMEGSVLTENHWLRSWSNELYLWYDEITDQDPATFDDPLSYFDVMKSTALTPSGNARDRFHFTMPTDEWLSQSQSGVSVGYGMALIINNPVPPREVIVQYVEPGAPADQLGIKRGTRILSVDGMDLVNGSELELVSAALLPSAAGERHQFEIQPWGEDTRRVVTLVAENVENSPVLHTDIIQAPAGDVGYLLFNEHVATAEAALVDAFTEFSNAGVDELVLDLRYNGGGYLAIAAQVAYMVAGNAHTRGKIFELQSFNDKHPTFNPITGKRITAVPFYNETIGFSRWRGSPLPSLDLDRVVVLSSVGTCSASEAIINGLRGAGVEVILIGDTTCGKPYGFFPQDNCGTTYFTIQFRGENNVGFGDYADGFSPVNTMGAAGELLPGCAVADDFSRELGDPLEAQLNAALDYLIKGADSCPAPSVISFHQSQPSASSFSMFADLPTPPDILVLPASFMGSERIMGTP